MTKKPWPDAPRSVNIGANATGSVSVTGDMNTVSIRGDRFDLSQPDQNIAESLRELSELLRTDSDGNEDGKVLRELANEAEAIKYNTDDIRFGKFRDVVGNQVTKALIHARSAENFAKNASKLAEIVPRIVSWLGSNWISIFKYMD
jgi:hypothetical protein